MASASIFSTAATRKADSVSTVTPVTTATGLRPSMISKRYTSLLRHFHLPHLHLLHFHSLQVRGIFNIPLPEVVVLQSGRSEEGAFLGKYVKIPLNEEMKHLLESSELLQRDLREYLTEKVNEHEWNYNY